MLLSSKKVFFILRSVRTAESETVDLFLAHNVGLLYAYCARTPPKLWIEIYAVGTPRPTCARNDRIDEKKNNAAIVRAPTFCRTPINIHFCARTAPAGKCSLLQGTRHSL